MKVVANAGPLMALGKLGLVHLLHLLYGPVLVPAAVHEEVVIRGLELDQPDAYAVQLALARGELALANIEDAELSKVVQALPVHRGEKHVIQLGLNEMADCVLLDDLLAREQAQRLGLKVKGTLGVIAEAHRRGLMTLQEAELVFQAIVDREDIWISEALVRRVWDQVRQGANDKP